MKKIDPELFILLRRKVFTSDIQKILKVKGKLGDLFARCGGTAQQVASLHDGLEDCKALAVVMRHHKMSFEDICRGARSLEPVQQRTSNPLLKAGLIISTVANKMPQQMTCMEYLDLTDEELELMLKNIGAGAVSIRACLSKRTQYCVRRNNNS